MLRTHALALLAALLWACGARPAPGAPVGMGPTPTTAAAADVAAPDGARGPALDFALDPVERDPDHVPESLALRGKRAVVIVVATFDFGSEKLLRVLGPTLRELPGDATCLIVAMQPLADRVLVQTFLDAEPTPCRRAIGDPSRGRLGDLAKVKVVPAVLVLRADGSLVGAAAGDVKPEALKAELEKAKR